MCISQEPILVGDTDPSVAGTVSRLWELARTHDI